MYRPELLTPTPPITPNPTPRMGLGVKESGGKIFVFMALELEELLTTRKGEEDEEK